MSNSQHSIVVAIVLIPLANALHGSSPEMQVKEATSHESELQTAIDTRHRLQTYLLRLIALAHPKELGQKSSPNQLSTAVMRIRCLKYNLQESDARISSFELARARAINRVSPGAISREEMHRLHSQNQIEKLLLESMRLKPSAECPETRSRLVGIKVSTAELRLQIAETHLSEASRFPPKTISEIEYRQLQSAVTQANRQLNVAKSARQQTGS